jgi:hypothetical protein
MSYRAAGQEQSYVSVSRGKRAARIYTDGRFDLLDAVSKSDLRMSATELVADRKRRLRATHISKNRERQSPKQQNRDKEKERVYG